jgi:hypothetical protein
LNGKDEVELARLLRAAIAGAVGAARRLEPRDILFDRTAMGYRTLFHPL